MEEKPLPKETQSVFRRLSARTEEEQKATENVLKDFFKLTDAGWVHNKCERVIADFKGKAEIARENGKRGGRPPKNPQETQRVIFDNPAETRSKANQEPIANNHKPVIINSKKASSLPDAEWIESLKAIYAWVDIPSEILKIDSWISVNPQRQKTRRFIINWLNRIEKPMDVNSSTTQPKHDHRAEKRAREFPEQIVVPLI